MKPSKKILSKLYMALVLAFFYLPILYTVVFSFNAGRSLTRFDGFSLRWYEKMFNDSTMMSAVFYTIVIALLATAISTVVGTIAAIGLSNSKKLVRGVMEQVNNLPLTNPDIVTAIGLLMFFSVLGIRKGFVTMLLAHVMFCIPYVMLSIMPKLRSLDPEFGRRRAGFRRNALAGADKGYRAADYARHRIRRVDCLYHVLR